MFLSNIFPVAYFMCERLDQKTNNKSKLSINYNIS